MNPRAPSVFSVHAVTAGGARAVRVPAGLADVHAALAGPGPAVYTALRSFGGDRFLALDAHLARLADSCARVGLAPPDRAAVRRSLRGAVAAWGVGDCRVRIDVRAAAPPLLPTDARVLIGLWPHVPVDPARLAVGVMLRTAAGARREAPRAKGSAWIHARSAWTGGPPADEHALIDPEGGLLEGFTSNLLAIRRGVVITAEQGVLHGVTRGLLLGLCGELGLRVERAAYPLGEREALDELGMCSSIRGLWPVVRLDGVPVGDGRPGPIIRRLAATYAARLPSWLSPA